MIEKPMQQRREATEQYEAAGRNELFEKESQEAEILKTYLPEKMSEDDVIAMIERIISDMGEVSMKEMGNIMAALKNEAGLKIDMTLASQMVRQIISKQASQIDILLFFPIHLDLVVKLLSMVITISV